MYTRYFPGNLFCLGLPQFASLGGAGGQSSGFGAGRRPHSQRHLGCQFAASAWMASLRSSEPFKTSHLGHIHHLWMGVSMAYRHTGQQGSTSKPALE